MLLEWIKNQLKTDEKKTVIGAKKSREEARVIKDWARSQIKQMAEFRGKLVL